MDEISGATPGASGRDRQQMLRLLADQMPVVIWTTDPDLKFVSSMGGGLPLLGLTPDRLAGMSLFEYFGTTDEEFAPIAAHRRALAGESVSYQLAWSNQVYSAQVQPLRGPGDRIEGVVGVALDVTDRDRAEKELKRLVALLRSTLDSTEDGILVVDDAGRIVTYNRRFVEMWGIPEELVEAGDDDKAIAYVLDQLVDPGLMVTRTMDHYAHLDTETYDLLKFKNGRVFERFSPAPSAPGAERVRVWSFRDITDRIRADEERSRSLSLLEATLESTADGLLVVDTDGKIVSYNRKFVEMWKIPESVVASGDDARALAFVLDQLKAPDSFLKKVRDLYDHPDSQSFDWLEFHDGRVFERYSQPQRVGGATIGRVWSFRDVSDRLRMEEILRRQARTFEHMFDAVIVTDLSGGILDCNPGAEKMFGYSREAMLGKNPEMLLSPAEERDKTAKMLDGMRHTGRWQGSVRFRRNDGARGTSETVVVPHSDEYGRLTAAIFVHRDVTAVKELERQLREMQGNEDSGMGRG
ncbi:MAG: PAS domain S-box protein [Thermoanaerobaculia bacterium]